MKLSTFNVANVEKNTSSLQFSTKENLQDNILKELSAKKMEFIPETPKNCSATETNGLATLIDICFYQHRPLLLTPDCN
jgi:hypothetical protein